MVNSRFEARSRTVQVVVWYGRYFFVNHVQYSGPLLCMPQVFFGLVIFSKNDLACVRVRPLSE